MRLIGLRRRQGTVAPDGTRHTEPGRVLTVGAGYATDDQLFAAIDETTGSIIEAWLYRALPLDTMRWTDPNERLAHASHLYRLLAEVGASSRARRNFVDVDDLRAFHLRIDTWYEQARPPAGATSQEQAWLEDAFELADGRTLIWPHRLVTLGIKLRRRWQRGTRPAIRGGTRQAFQRVATALIGGSYEDLDAFALDAKEIATLLAVAGARKLTRDEWVRLTSWYNDAAGSHIDIYDTTDCLHIGRAGEAIEMVGLKDIGWDERAALDAPWLADLLATMEGPICVSVRGDLEPAGSARKRIRKIQRQARGQWNEDQRSGDEEQSDVVRAYHDAKQLEAHLEGSSEPWVNQLRVTMGCRSQRHGYRFADLMANSYDIEIAELPGDQLRALGETLPGYLDRPNPWPQEASLESLTHAGPLWWSNLGDPSGDALVGLSQPHGTPCWLDTKRSARANRSPITLCLASSGAGKTFLALSIAVQATLSGRRCIYMDPKTSSDLSPVVDLVDGEVIGLSALSRNDGALDPFRWAPAELAGEYARDFLWAGLGYALAGEHRDVLGKTLNQAAAGGARCVAEALRLLDRSASTERTLADQIDNMLASNPLMRLGVSPTPREPLNLTRSALSLIRFDRYIPVPQGSKQPSDYDPAERMGAAVINLVFAACVEILLATRGGALIADEAHHFLGFEEGQKHFDRLGRLGRSLDIWAMVLTQRPTDLLGGAIDLEEHTSRLFLGRLKSDTEAIAGLDALGLDTSDDALTQARLEWLESAGPGENPSGESRYIKPAQFLHRDLDGRVAPVAIGPVPATFQVAADTNPEGVAARHASHAAVAAAADAMEPTR